MSVSLYSIAIIPDADVVRKVEACKNQLKEAIGWYNAVNSIAHITISEFELNNEYALPNVKEHIEKIARRQPEVNVCFNELMKFHHGTFCVLPDEASKECVTKIITDFHELPIKNTAKNRLPHITIGKGLSDKEMYIAGELITRISLKFKINSVVLRKFNEELNHYDIVDEYPFLNQPKDMGIQQSLF